MDESRTTRGRRVECWRGDDSDGEMLFAGDFRHFPVRQSVPCSVSNFRLIVRRWRNYLGRIFFAIMNSSWSRKDGLYCCLKGGSPAPAVESRTRRPAVSWIPADMPTIQSRFILGSERLCLCQDRVSPPRIRYPAKFTVLIRTSLLCPERDS